MDATASPEIRTLEICLAHFEDNFATWRDAFSDWTANAPPTMVFWPQPAHYVWAIKSGDLDSDMSGADDPADQVYFAVRDGLVKIGSSGRPSQRLSPKATLTRTIFGGSREEAMMHNLFRSFSVYRDDRAEGSYTEWYRPCPLLVELAAADAFL